MTTRCRSAGKGTALDRAVMRRGTSVYFTDKVVPMLPACLSNGACSLNPGEDKYTLSALITLDSKGEIIDTEIKRTVICSEIKGIYREINLLLEGSAGASTSCLPLSRMKPQNSG